MNTTHRDSSFIPRNLRLSLSARLLLAVLGGSLVPAAEVDVAAGIRAAKGVVVHVGCGDAALTVGFTDRDTRMVQGLCRTDAELTAANNRIVTAQLGGWVGVRRVDESAALPYASHLADVVVADLDALGKAEPSRDELLRIAAPGGSLYTKQGTWQRIVKPMPVGVDEWTHEEYGPEGNPCSKDKIVAPSFALQWISGYQGTDQGMENQVLRVAGGRTIFFRNTPSGSSNPVAAGSKRGGRAYFIEGRNAWNGTLLWRRAMAVTANVYAPLIATADRVYTVIDIFASHAMMRCTQPLRCRDSRARRAGKVRRYPGR